MQPVQAVSPRIGGQRAQGVLGVRGAVATTRSPGAKPVTPSPAAATTPVVEYPMALGLTGPSIT